MSVLLGPIHIWLYNKIQLQDELTQVIFDEMMEKGFATELIGQIDDICGTLEKGELVDIVDKNDIHGWLQDRITIVEKRLAYLVTMVLRNHPDRITEIKGAVHGYAVSHSAGQALTPFDAYNLVENTVLNGMPCDRINNILDESDESVTWTNVIDIHVKYWNEVRGDVKYYYEIMECLVNGMLEESKIVITSNGKQSFELKRVGKDERK